MKRYFNTFLKGILTRFSKVFQTTVYKEIFIAFLTLKRKRVQKLISPFTSTSQESGNLEATPSRNPMEQPDSTVQSRLERLAGEPRVIKVWSTCLLSSPFSTFLCTWQMIRTYRTSLHYTSSVLLFLAYFDIYSRSLRLSCWH